MNFHSQISEFMWSGFVSTGTPYTMIFLPRKMSREIPYGMLLVRLCLEYRISGSILTSQSDFSK